MSLIMTAQELYNALHDVCAACMDDDDARVDWGGDCDRCRIRAALAAADGRDDKEGEK